MFCFPNSHQVMFPRKFNKLCIHVHVHRTTIERESSLGHHHVILNGKTRHNLKTSIDCLKIDYPCQILSFRKQYTSCATVYLPLNALMRRKENSSRKETNLGENQNARKYRRVLYNGRSY